MHNDSMRINRIEEETVRKVEQAAPKYFERIPQISPLLS